MPNSFASKVVSLLIGVIFSSTALSAAKVDPALKSLVNGEKESVNVTVLMETPQHVFSPSKYDREAVLNYLQEATAISWDKVSQYVETDSAASHVSNVRLHWINQSFTATVDLEGLKLLANAPGVKKIYREIRIDQQKAVSVQASEEASAEMQTPTLRKKDSLLYGMKDIGLDKVIKKNRRINGRRVRIGVLDTGVDGTHPLLKDKTVAYFDGKLGKTTQEPLDHGCSPWARVCGHGTHVAGTILGGSYHKNFVGVAPKAKLIAASGLVTIGAILDAMQFMLDPDGNPKTDDAPRAVNNSWGLLPSHMRALPDQEIIYRAVSAWEAAGIVPVFAAGNEGKNGDETLRHPQAHPATLVVGATGENKKITDFSSKGPGYFKGTKIQKPDLTAPGKDIYSAVLRGGKNKMAKMSGTSMAAPHVTGVVALMLQVNKRLRPDHVKRLLKMTASATDLQGNFNKKIQRKKLWRIKSKKASAKILEKTWNKVYGNGRMNAYDAIRAAGAAQSWFWQRRSRLLLAFGAEEATSGFGLEDGSQELEEEVLPTAKEAMAFPAEWEGKGWLSAEDLI